MVFTQFVSCTLGAVLVIALVFLVALIVFGYAVNSMVLYRSIFNVGNVLDENLSFRDLYTLCKRLLMDRYDRLFDTKTVGSKAGSKADLDVLESKTEESTKEPSKELSKSEPSKELSKSEPSIESEPTKEPEPSKESGSKSKTIDSVDGTVKDSVGKDNDKSKDKSTDDDDDEDEDIEELDYYADTVNEEGFRRGD
ncbi:hypothetical protein Hz2V095 [Helicoverpa zea nudivirus 2]|uniref:Uncharacterized protein n=1 Tax=Helicoverpa zea nudivirus 2 TaxID=1128424 RepID=G9I0C1_HZNV2|nr:orf95 gene product [Helicoverpa zea nudivirus 2]AEW69644.1 hypothetical protein Hz2V095 [Helicoverpa zea nudivirus 2]